METKPRLNVAAGDINFALKQENEEDKHEHDKRRTSTIIHRMNMRISMTMRRRAWTVRRAFFIMNMKL